MTIHMTKPTPRYKHLFYLTIIFIILVPAQAYSRDGLPLKIPLTLEEQKWLARHKNPIRIGLLDIPPHTMKRIGRPGYEGICIDYLDLLKNNLKLNFELFYFNSSNELLAQAASRKIDMVMAVPKTAGLTKYFIFTEPYLTLPNSILVRNDYTGSSDLNYMGETKMALTSENIVHDLINEHYGHIKIISVNDDVTALKKTSIGEADSTVMEVARASHFIQKEGINNLKIAGSAGFESKLRFASRKDWPILNLILEKGLASISEQEKKIIYRKWVHLKQEAGWASNAFFLILITCLILTLILFGGASTWNRVLKRQVAQRTRELEKQLAARKIAQDALKENEEKFRLMAETTHDFIWSIDTNLQFTYINHGGLNMLGYDDEADLYNGSPISFVRPEYIDRIYESGRIIQAKHQRGERPLDSYELDLIHKTGKIIHAEISATGIIERTKITGYHGRVRDITERKSAETALRESEARLSLALEASNATVWELNYKTNELFMDDNIIKILGYESGEIGRNIKSWIEVTHPDDVETLLKSFEETAGGLKSDLYFEHRNMTKDGEWKWIQVSGRVVKYDENNKPEIMLGISIDITERKRIEEERIKLEAQVEQSRRMEAIGTLAGGIAHDINNILTPIMGFTEISLRMVPDNKKLTGNLKKVLDAGARARDLVKQILAFSRQSTHEPSPMKVKDIIVEASKLMRASLPATIEIQLELKTDALILADSTRIHQVLMNVCTNSAHAMKDNGGLIRIKLDEVRIKPEYSKLHPEFEPGSYVLISIADTGHGIQDEYKDKIFEPFFTTKRLGEGTGLGLSVVHGIVKSYNGSINIHSEQGRGTTIKVFLPVFKHDAEAGVIKIQNNPRGGSESILVIDDETALLDTMDQMLSYLGYQATHVGNPVEALELYRTNPDGFDLVITDMTMPKITGDLVAREIQTIRPKMPVIIMTGYNERIETNKTLEAGMNQILLKPFALNKLAVSIRRALDGRDD